MNTHDKIELPPLRIPDLEDELTAVLCAAISWGGSVISSEEYVAAKQRFRAAVNAAIEADRKRRGESAVQSDAEVAETCRAMGANSFAEFFGKTAPQPAEPVKDSVDIDDFIAVCIARGDMTKDAFLEARQWVRDTYYNPAEPVKRKRRYAQGTALGEFGIIPMCDQVDDEPVKVPSMRDLIADDADAATFQSVGQYRKALLARYGKGTP